MTPQERDLITALFARLQQQGGQAKDPEAETLIRQAAAQQPDAIYLLTQTVLIQDMALHEAQNRIAALEQRGGAPADASAQAAPGFLPQPPGASGHDNRGSVPSAGPWQRAPAAPPAQRPVWTQTIAPPPGAPPATAFGNAPGYGPGYGYGPQMLAGSGGGFLRQAAATAAGVVGGSLLFQGISSMFGPHYGGGFLGGMPMQPGLSETVINNYYNDPGTTADATQNDAGDPGVQQADYDNQNAGQDVGNQDDGSFDQGVGDDGGADPGFDPGGGDFGGDDGGSF